MEILDWSQIANTYKVVSSSCWDVSI